MGEYKLINSLKFGDDLLVWITQFKIFTFALIASTQGDFLMVIQR